MFSLFNNCSVHAFLSAKVVPKSCFLSHFKNGVARWQLVVLKHRPRALSVMVSLAPILGFTDSPRLFYMQRDAFLVAQASNIMGLRENNFPISLPETEILVCLQCRQFWGASLLFWCLFGLFFLVLWASHCNTH